MLKSKRPFNLTSELAKAYVSANSTTATCAPLDAKLFGSLRLLLEAAAPNFLSQEATLVIEGSFDQQLWAPLQTLPLALTLNQLGQFTLAVENIPEWVRVTITAVSGSVKVNWVTVTLIT